jgi:hypothetical protein
MTLAAREMETVGVLVDVPDDELWVAAVLESVPGVAEPLDGVEASLLEASVLAVAALRDDGRSAIAELGGTSAAAGGTDPTDAVCDALTEAEAGADGADDACDACDAEFGEAAVDSTAGASACDGATRGAGASTVVVTDGSVGVEGGAGATAVTTGAVVVCVTGGGGGGSTGSTACWVCGAMLGAAGCTGGAFGAGAS